MLKLSGAETKLTRVNLKEFIILHNLEIVAILEPWVHSDKIRPRLMYLGLTSILTVEAIGFTGGIWLL